MPPELPDASTVEKIIRTVDQTDTESLSLRWGSLSVRIEQESERFAASGNDNGNAPAHDKTIAITAPLTGVFYGRPAPEQPAFVEVGGMVTKGQVVGLIETMKLFNEIVSEIEGHVAQILVEEGELVEANAPLIRVTPGEEHSL